MTPQQVSQFKQDGFYIDRGVFDADELKRLYELATTVQAKAKRHLYPGTRVWLSLIHI